MGCEGCAQKRAKSKGSWGKRLEACEIDARLALVFGAIAMYLGWSAYDGVKALRAERVPDGR